MINFYDQVPSVYNNASRDFQYMSWLINIVLNSVKHNVDDMYDLPTTSGNSRLNELLAMTLGFKVKRHYNQKQLTALINCLPSILRCKGTTKALSLAAIALVKASGSRSPCCVKNKTNYIEVQLPQDLVDTVLFSDLLPYIAPAGIPVRIVNNVDIEEPPFLTELDYSDDFQAAAVPVIAWESEGEGKEGRVSGIATMFKDSAFGDTEPVFTNFDADKQYNAGLLDNSIIASVETPLDDQKSKQKKKAEE